MITIFEGPRNSGKTFLAKHFSTLNKLPIFKFEFVDWFNSLALNDKSKSTHLFALGKEAMLMQLNRDGLLYDFILDRGFLTVFTWAIISGRITEEEAKAQIEIVINKGLISNIRIIKVNGKNPDTQPRNKDNWDFRDFADDESQTMERLITFLNSKCPQLQVIEIGNTFTTQTLEKLKEI